MTLDDANKIDEQAYDEMHLEHISEQTPALTKRARNTAQKYAVENL